MMKKYVVSGKVTAFISVELEAENKKKKPLKRLTKSVLGL